MYRGRIWIDEDCGTVWAIKNAQCQTSIVPTLVCGPLGAIVDLDSEEFQEPYETDMIDQDEIDAIFRMLMGETNDTKEIMLIRDKND